MIAIGKITVHKSATGHLKVNMFFQDAYQGFWMLENFEDVPSNHPEFGLFEFESGDQFCKWIDPNTLRTQAECDKMMQDFFKGEIEAELDRI